MALQGKFIYRAVLANNLIEHEYDYVLSGIYGKLPKFPNYAEVSDVKWVRTDDLLINLTEQPALYTTWFRTGLQVIV